MPHARAGEVRKILLGDGTPSAIRLYLKERLTGATEGTPTEIEVIG